MENELQAPGNTNQIAVAPEDAVLQMIERVATNPDADIAKMEKLMDMRDREFARIAEQAFAKDYVVMKPYLPTVTQSKYNDQTKSKYATLGDINKEIDPVLSKHGFSTSTNIVAQTDKDVTIAAILWHRDGHKESTQITIPMDSAGIKGSVNKTGVHATASSVTYARRYALCALLNISTGDDTDGNREPVDELATDAQRQAIADRLKQLTPEDQKTYGEKYGGVAEVRKIDVNLTLARISTIQRNYEEK
ncbi:MAG: ERF family protein [Candidatus Bathyarchaeia archaeon]